MEFWAIIDQAPPEPKPDDGDAPDDVEGRLPSGEGHKGSTHWKSKDKAKGCPKEAPGYEGRALLQWDPPGCHGLEGRKGYALKN